jgi:signal transduction histidine kinase
MSNRTASQRSEVGWLRSSVIRDVAVAIGAALAMSVRVGSGPPVHVSTTGEAAAAALAVLAALALVWRRQRPWLAALVGVTTSALYGLIAGPVAPIVGWIAIVVVARHVPRLGLAVRGAVAAALGVITGITAAVLVHDRASELPLLASLTVVVLLAAVLARLQTARAESVRRQREAESQRAIVGERLRIARDLHDLVGHGLSTIAVQSSAARLALDAGDPAAARRALVATEDSSRAALAEMRQLVGVLRLGESGQGPSPGLDQIDALADDARRAGHPVTVERIGPLDAVPGAASLTGYRVVQEAVTNAMRHAPGAAIAITVRAGDGQLTLDIADDGSGPRAAADDLSRYGLLGLRERTVAAGGTLDAGPRTDAPGWRLVVRLPLGKDVDS